MNITIGTPPQHFNVSLDVTSNAFFVPSIDCDDACRWWMPMHSYTANESSTYEPNGTSAVNDYWGDRYRGHLVRDTVRFGELEASNMTFLPFDERNTVSILGWDVGFDGLMGLAPPWNRYRHEYYPQEYPNFLEYVDQKKLVDEKVFSLALPRGLDDRGEFMLGGTNPNLYRGSFQTVKLLNDSDISHPYKGLWNIPIESITLNTSIPYHLPLNSNYTAAIVSEPIIILPTNFTRDLNKIIGATPFNWLWDAIPCDRRPYLPQLTFSIGGHNLTIDAFDYTFEFELPYGFAPACLTWFGAEDQYGYGDSTVVLGNTFLKGFYTRFDWGKREVGCEYGLLYVLNGTDQCIVAEVRR